MIFKKKIFWFFFWTIFITAFVITFASALFYALGLNFNYKTGKITRTSILIVDTNINEAKVWVDDKEAASPAKFNRIAPGPYTIKVQQEGYQSWEKNIELIAGEVLRINDALLVYEKPIVVEDPKKQQDIKIDYLAPEKFKLDQAELIISSPNGHFIAYKLANEIWLRNLDNNEDKLVTRFSSHDFSNLLWHDDNKHLFVFHENKIQVMDLDGLNICDLGITADNNRQYIFEATSGSKIIRFYQNGTIQAVSIEP